MGEGVALLLGGLSLAGLVLGCGPLDQTTFDEEALSECSEGLAEAEVDDNLQLIYATDESLHELVACGQLTVDISIALYSGLIEMVLEGDSKQPGGLEYQGGGQYLTRTDEGHRIMDMLVSLFEESGGELQAIEYDVFDRESYLVGVSSRIEGEDVDVALDLDNPLASDVDVQGTLIVEFEATGPLVHLLGLGDDLESPLVFELKDLDDIEPRLSDLRIRANVDLEDARDGDLVAYDVVTPDMNLVEVATAANVGYDVNDISGTGETLGQELQLLNDGWDVEFVDGNLDGTADFRVTGGDFDYTAGFTYRDSKYADVVLACD